MNPLLTFIENQSKLGATRDVITNQLLGQGWKRLDIDQAFISLEVPATPVISATPITASSAPPAFTPPIAPSSQPSQPMSIFTPPIQSNTMPNQNMPVQKKSHTGLIIAIIIILLLIGGGIYAYQAFLASQAPVPTTMLPVTENTPAPISTPAYIPIATTTPTPTPIVQVKPAPVKVPGTWQNDSGKYLCWDGKEPNCTASDMIDLNGNRSVLLGAVEYCQYLDPNGATIDKTIQNFWRLPTISELLAEGKSNPTSFHYNKYWSSTMAPTDKAVDSPYYMHDFSTDWFVKSNGAYVRCIQ